jgi:hypothetical protein
MRAFQTHALRLAIITAIAAGGVLLNGQVPSSDTKSNLIAVSIAMKQDHIPSGQKPLVILTAKNISRHNLFPSLYSDYRLNVKGEKGEPPLTYYHRQLRKEPGVPALTEGGPPRFPLNIEGEKPYEGIPPGGSEFETLDLTILYNLIPGQYTVYLEVQDKAGVWLRTNTLQFEITATGQ